MIFPSCTLANDTTAISPAVSRTNLGFGSTGAQICSEKQRGPARKRKQGSNGGGRCGTKDGRGGWAALDPQAGKVSKRKGAIKAAANRGGRKRATAIAGGWQRRQAVGRRGRRGDSVAASCSLRSRREEEEGGSGVRRGLLQGRRAAGGAVDAAGQRLAATAITRGLEREEAVASA
ncbi:hypothetical protein B296_00042383 [Ensete ventricosum]|uniref:Uncharacterized protein n=1 Tax=Ensete ventricosum TaxID=4639 RepID=A0A426XJI7_ENSVE|nr:hypothetical protein B296_00042383 [Ensete ventricosum]